MITKIASKLYGSIVNRRNIIYDKKTNQVKVNVPVISIGNLSVGGTGKTPFTQMMAQGMLAMGYKPAIVGKGYKRKTKGELIISDGSKVKCDAEAGGDEMVLLAETCKVPVVVHDEKYQAAISAVDNFKIDSIIVDDGFQHRQLMRDLDIVLIDQETLELNKLIPEGRLREPVSSVARADVICLKGNMKITDELMQFLNVNHILIRVKPVPQRPYDLDLRQAVTDDEIVKIKQGVVAVTGIAKPNNFADMLRGMNINILADKFYRDHHNFTERDIENIAGICIKNNCYNIAVTEKDAVKLKKFSNMLIENNINTYVFPISLTITDGKEEFIEKLKSIMEK